MVGRTLRGMTSGIVTRQPRGIRIGGQFAATVHAEPAVSLVAPSLPAPPAAPAKFAETQRKIRGHNFYAPKKVLSKVPALGSTEDIPFEEKKFHLYYFAGGASNW